MKQKRIIIIPALLLLGVFCFWYFLYPEVLSAAEERVLIVWDADFLKERLCSSGGWYLLPWELIAQFFYDRLTGAIVLALIVVLLYQLLCWLISQWQAKSYAARLFTFILPFSALLFCLLPFQMAGGTSEERIYDYLMRNDQWEEVARRGGMKDPTSQACHYAVLLSQWKMGQIQLGEVANALIDSQNAMTNEVTAFIMSEFYIQLGLVNLSQRASFEAMEAIPTYAKSARSLKRLTETALITGQSELALKYLYLLEQTIHYRSWAQHMRPYAEHPELVDPHPVLGMLRELYLKSENKFFY